MLVREDQLSLAIGRRGQNVRLASKLVGWDIEIMTSEELDELIEKAVTAFTRIEGVDTELAEKLVEQGILSFDDLSVMEIDDLVNTIEGLTEELAETIIARAEQLAEEQADELPRRKGGRMGSAAAVEPPAEAEAEAEAEEAPPSEEAIAAEAAADAADAAAEEESDASALAAAEGDAEAGADTPEVEEFHDLELASELRWVGPHEVTSAPNDADLTETERIITEAVESGASQQEIEAKDDARAAASTLNSPASPPEPAPPE